MNFTIIKYINFVKNINIIEKISKKRKNKIK